MSNNLGGDRVTASQTQKEVPINDSLEVLDGAISEKLAVAVTSSNAKTLTAEEFYKNQTFVVDEDGGDPATAAITLTVPSTGPLPDSVVNAPRGNFNIVNDTAFDVTVTISGQSLTAPVVAAGDRALLSSDGVDVYQPAGGGIGGVAVEDDGSPIVSEASTLNFTGAGVTVTDGGGGQADIAIPGGGGTDGSGNAVIALVESQSFTTQANVDFTDINPQAGETFFAVISDLVVSADDTQLLLRVSDDNGATFEATTYEWSGVGIDSDGTGLDANNNADTSIHLTSTVSLSGLGNAANEGGLFRVELGELTAANTYKTIQFGSSYLSSSDANATFNGSGQWRGGTGTINAFRVLPSSGTISGRISLYRVKPIGSSALIKGQMSGLLLSNNGTDSDHDIDIATGNIVADNASTVLSLGSALTKQIDAAWAVGNNAGGLFSGTVAADTWYHVFLIEKDSDGTLDAGFDTSIAAANIPSGYTNYGRIGSVLTDASANILAFKMLPGRVFIWDQPPFEEGTAGSNPHTFTASSSVPPGVFCRVDGISYTQRSGGGARGVTAYHPGLSGITPSTSLNTTTPPPDPWPNIYGSGGTSSTARESFNVYSDDSQQLSFSVSDTSTFVGIQVNSYQELGQSF